MTNRAVKVAYLEAAAPATPASGEVVTYAKADGLMYSKDDAGVETLMSGGGGGGGAGELLAIEAYQPGSFTPTTTNTTFVDVDATNLAITFTTPASTNVLIVLSAMASMSTTGYQAWGLREGGSDIGPSAVACSDTINNPRQVRLLLTGLSAGSHTLKWSWLTNNAGVTARMYADPLDGPATMEVWSAP